MEPHDELVPMVLIEKQPVALAAQGRAEFAAALFTVANDGQSIAVSSSDSTSNDDVSATPRKQPESSSAMGSHDTQWLKFATYSQIKRHVIQTQPNQLVEDAMLSRGELLQLSYQPGGLRTLLLGTVRTASPLSRLRAYPQLTIKPIGQTYCMQANPRRHHL